MTATQPPQGRIRQIFAAYRMTKRTDKFLPLILLTVFLITIAISGTLVLLFVPGLWLQIIFSVSVIMLGIISVLFVFGKRAERAAYAQLEGQPGAAVAIVQNMRKWTITSAVAADRSQNLVHRAVSRAGVVLIAEGSSGIGALLSGERKRTQRFIGEAPLTEIVIGNSSSTVPLSDLQKKLKKLPKKLSKYEAAALRKKLEAVGGSNLPLPKGPMPKSTNIRVPRQ
jgi:multisubunit Na+/H+ antiporter MnhC subunit